MEESKVCIGIPFTTWNELVEESVGGCLSLDYKNFTVILAPNEGVNIPDKFAADPRIVISPTKTSAIAVKRNAAIKNCDGEFYACIDSDAYPEKSWLKNALAAFQKSNDIWAVGGPNLSPEYSSVKKRAVAGALKSFLVGGPRVFAKRLSSDRFVDDLQTCNLIFKKEAILKTGGFDEGFVTAEDTDICEKIRKFGKKIYFAKNVVVYHHNRSLWLPFVKQKIVFGYAVMPFIKKHFSIGKLFIFLPFIFIIYALLGWLTVFFSRAPFLFWVYSMLFYFIICLIEAKRWSNRPKDTPFTFLAIVIGNIFPGIGTFVALVGAKIDFTKFYKNYESGE